MTIAALVVADDGLGHMDGWGWGIGMGIAGLIILLLVVGLIAWLIVSVTQRSSSRTGGSRSALDLLDERYARGEIDRNDYLARRADLEERT
jgi:putative membrane protein